jgi:uncharacterized membrane protein YccF (DUF307 family)
MTVSTTSLIWFMFVGWWAGLVFWVFGLLFKITIIGWPLGEMCDDLAHSMWRV